VSAATAGAVVASRRPTHPVGWLLLASAVLLAATGVAAAYGPYGLLARPGALPAAGLVAVRLFDLDRIISRTVAYGLLTLLLGGGYAAVVLGLGVESSQHQAIHLVTAGGLPHGLPWSRH
jgi:hypothetical protein